MYNPKQSILITKAVSEVASCIKSVLDFDKKRMASRAEIEASCAHLGMSPVDPLKRHDELFNSIKITLDEHCEQKAIDEVTNAVVEAMHEVELHKLRLACSRQANMEMLESMESAILPEWGRDSRLVSSVADMKTLAQESFESSMKAIQQTHRATLISCFRRHLVSGPTARELADLYEAK